MHLASRGEGALLAPPEIGENINASTSYLSKVNTQLVRAGILRSFRGMKGGVALARPPGKITLLEVVEACEGPYLADYCTDDADLRQVCGFHKAMSDLHEAVTSSLGRWTLADLVAKPMPSPKLRGKVGCILKGTVQLG
ncbi:MAG: Rrf2 family transcriptional regulator [Myxococcales bacterium]|nr:Rrf2 family transcriptional regulator [Myxococcales bacterium]